MEISQNHQKLNLLQNEIKKQKNISNLFNSKKYTKNLEKAYFEAYDKYTNQNLDNIDLN